MSFHQHWQLVQYQFRDINLSYSLFQCPTAMSDDLDDLVHKRSVRGDLGVPSIHKVLYDYGDDSVKLDVDLI